jgi:hypothetical protein
VFEFLRENSEVKTVDMKKLVLLLSITLAYQFLNAQLILTKAYTPQTGAAYIELTNNNTTPVPLGCYSVVSYFNNPLEKGFSVINLPDESLAPNAVLTISGVATTKSGGINLFNYSYQSLQGSGRIQQYFLNENENAFLDHYNPVYNSTLNAVNNYGNSSTDHLVLLMNSNTLVDASFALDDNKNIPAHIRNIPVLGYTNSCGNQVNIHFNTLQSMYPTVFNRSPYERNEYGLFREFEIHKNTASVQIAWQTANEQNLRGFEIERRIENKPWTTIGFAASMAPSGNSHQVINYLYGDNTLLGDNVEYRLKQIDVNGQSYYSAPRRMNMLENKDVVLYPNPSIDGRVTVALGKLNSLRDIQVVDINGQLVQQWLSVNNNTQQINDLKRGNYIVRVIDHQTGTLTSEKLIVQ